MQSDISPNDIVTWFREQARKFAEIADTVENTFRVTNGLSGVHQISPPIAIRTDSALLLAIRSELRAKNMRVGKLAQRLNVNEEAVSRLVTRENGFTIGERGWIRLADEKPSEKDDEPLS